MKRVPIRVCSGRKTAVRRGALAEIYEAPMLQAFFRKFKTYCVLSRKLGICHSGVVYENYGDHEEKDRGALARLLASQAPAYQDTVFIYWNHRPLTHDGFVRLMRDAGFHVVEGRSLGDVERLLAYQATIQRCLECGAIFIEDDSIITGWFQCSECGASHHDINGKWVLNDDMDGPEVVEMSDDEIARFYEQGG